MEKMGTYLILDTEATGFHPHKNGLIEFAALVLDSRLEVVDSMQSYINPPNNIEYDPEAMEVNKISQSSIDAGISYKDFCTKFIELVTSNYTSKPIAIAQFYPFDAAYLNYVFEVSGYGSYLSGLLGNDYVDTKSMVNIANMKARLEGRAIPFPITSLSKQGGLKEILNIKSNGYDAHTAMGDVLATRDVLIALLKLL